jgi:TolA-binding protein
MSGHQAHSVESPSSPAPAGGWSSRLRALPSELFSWSRRNPLRASLVAGCVLAMTGCLAWLIPAYLSSPPVARPALADALAALDRGDDEAAQRIALEVRADPTLTFRELGGPLYVIGRVLARQAGKQENAREQQLLYLVAARFLQEARNRDFPAGCEEEGLFQLGQAWHLAGEHPRAIEALRSALQHESPQTTTIRQLLADSYLRSNPPQYEAALEMHADMLTGPPLDAQQQQTILLRDARIRLALHQLPRCRLDLQKLPEEARLAPQAVLLEAQLLLAEGDAVLAGDDKQYDQARTLYEQAAEQLRSLPPEKPSQQTPPLAAQYLLGVCFQRLGDEEAALAQFGRVRRYPVPRPEIPAALLSEVELLVRHQNFAEAVELVARAAAEPVAADNPWISTAEMQKRLSQVQQALLDANAFEPALEMAEMPAGLVADWQLAQWKAAAYEARAAAREREAESVTGSQAAELLSQARHDRRQAGREATRLAELRKLTRDYSDDLWRSADQYYQGRAYRQAVAAIKKYLLNESRQRRPDALLLLGQSQLALNEPEQACETLTECLEIFPKHPAAYQTRLVAAQAYAERGLLEDARQLLSANVESDDLSPASSQWRDSLFLLGKTLHREGTEHEANSRGAAIDSDNRPDRQAKSLAEMEASHRSFRSAIEQLGKAVQRYPDAPQAHAAEYLLADAYRQSSKWPRKKLKTISIESTRAALARQSQLDLEAAVAEYDQLIARLEESQDASANVPLDKQILRNSYFSKADALFDLGRYDDAIKAYSAASNRYQSEPEALGAYMQIAACYRLQHKQAEARGTLQQAQAVLQRIKPDANFARATPYNREQWQQLLKWLGTL